MVDVVARLTAPIAPGSDAPGADRVPRRRVGRQRGGLAGRRGARPALVARVGEDERGRAARAELRRGGRGCAPGRRSTTGRPAPASCWSRPAASARCSRTPGPTTASRPATCRTSCSLRAATSTSPATRWFAPARERRRAPRSSAPAARRMTVSVDPSSAALLSPEFLDLARGADLLLPNVAEAEALTGERRPGARRPARLADTLPRGGREAGRARGALDRRPRRCGASRRRLWRRRSTPPARATRSPRACWPRAWTALSRWRRWPPGAGSPPRRWSPRGAAGGARPAGAG